jgi:glycerophosphoryl diester phosphodiesterase
MINRYFLFFGILFFLLPLCGKSQQVVRNSDTLTLSFTTDSVSILQWQFSDDLIFWKNLKEANQPQLIIDSVETGFYRTKIKQDNNTFFSDTILVYITPADYKGPEINDQNTHLKLSWDVALPSYLISHYRVSIEGCDSTITLPGWRNSLLIEREMSLYGKLFTIEAIPNGNFMIPKQKISFENNFSRFFNDKPLIVAHRGVSSIYSENTLVAFEKAAEAGFNYVECDIRLTKDDVWVLNHDESIDRTSDGKGKIADYYYDDLKKFNFAAHKKSEGKIFQEILSLSDFIRFCKKNNLKPIIEIKEEEYRHLNLIDMLRTINTELAYDQYAIQCFDIKTLRKIRRIDEKVVLGMLAKKYKSSHKQTLNVLYPCFYNIAFTKSLMDKPLDDQSNNELNQLFNSGFYIGTWTVDNPACFENLISHKWFITTDMLHKN